jgi:hypothetical protein
VRREIAQNKKATAVPVDKAQKIGVYMALECAWIGPPDQDGFTPFGPNSQKDNIFQNMPQVYLHV